MNPDDSVSHIAAAYGWSDEDLNPEIGPLARRFAPVRPATAGLSLDSRVVIAPTAGHFADHYLGEPDSGQHLIVTIAEYPSASQARRHLAMVLHNCMTKLTDCRARGLELGELCYCDGHDPPLGLIFVRSNVFVDVASVGVNPVPAVDAAAEVDGQIRDHIATQEGADHAEPI